MNFVVPRKLLVATRQPNPFGSVQGTLGRGIFARIALAMGLIRAGSIIFNVPATQFPVESRMHICCRFAPVVVFPVAGSYIGIRLPSLSVAPLKSPLRKACGGTVP